MDDRDPLDSCSAFRVLPDTCVELFINYKESGHTTIDGKVSVQHPQSFIVSRMSRYMDVEDRSGSIAVCFLPGAASHFFQVAMNQVSDTVISLPELWGTAAKEMVERIADAVNNNERVSIIQQYLVTQLAKQKENDRRIAHWLWQVNFARGQVSVDELSRKVNISHRQLGRHFNHHVGLSPKEFLSVSRFIHSLAWLKKYPTMSLTSIGYESGYYDQAHFIHDYKKFAGMTPGELIASGNILF
jgi:AraC-like DNA-binding protein